ncbi:hypothetical protein IFM89_000446 [Coptis chinensis]|uniref:RNase H type-1 domain-containing protein n=1 Tax=Coptis chinensis TaxID=261450 RepID=A0A835I8H4_9MAGN|nr:hypothetical protein IFM89_000446 [Coptis chinensis]
MQTEATMWKQRSNIKEEIEGDKNYAYFQAKAKIRQAKTFIEELRTAEGIILQDQKSIKDFLVQSYEEKFKASPEFDGSNMEDEKLVEGQISEVHAEIQDRVLVDRLGLEVNYKRKERIQCIWAKPERGVFKLNTDGAVSEIRWGTGGVVRDAYGEVIFGYLGSGGLKSVLFQELTAILQASTAARSILACKMLGSITTASGTDGSSITASKGGAQLQ